MRLVSVRSAIFVGLLSTLSAVGSPIIFGSGVNGSGTALALGAGDPHWMVSGGPSYVGQGATPTEASSLGVPVGWPISGGAYASPSGLAPFAQWIAPVPAPLSMSESADTEFDYSTTFDLTGFQLSTVEVKGFWSADNQTLGLFLNGIMIPGTTITGTPAHFQFESLTPFDLTTGFIGGVNTLSVHTLNANTGNPNPSGVIVQVSATGIADVPEPGTLAVVSSGLLLLGLVHKRRRRS